MCTAQNIIGTHLPSIRDISEVRCLRRAKKIQKTITTPATACSPCCRLSSDTEVYTIAPPDYRLSLHFVVQPCVVESGLALAFMGNLICPTPHQFGTTSTIDYHQSFNIRTPAITLTHPLSVLLAVSVLLTSYQCQSMVFNLKKVANSQEWSSGNLYFSIQSDTVLSDILNVVYWKQNKLADSAFNVKLTTLIAFKKFETCKSAEQQSTTIKIK